MRTKLIVIFLSLFLSLLMGCTNTFTYSSLVNQGILPVSTENAFLGTNMFLSEEMEDSEFLYNFFQSKGAPHAIQINIDSLRGDPELWLYYPQEKEAYIASLFSIKKEAIKKYEWVIRGPFSLRRLDYKTITAIAEKNKGVPVFYLIVTEHRFIKPSPNVTVAKVLSPKIPVVKKRPVRKRVTPKKVEESVKSNADPKNQIDTKLPDPTTPTVTNFVPLNTDQQAILISQGYAERAYNGDILHLVRNNSESLESICEWYTSSKNNVSEIKDLNHLVADELQPGQKIRIPLKMIKNLKAMPTFVNSLEAKPESQSYIKAEEIESHLPKDKLLVTPKLPESDAEVKLEKPEESSESTHEDHPEKSVVEPEPAHTEEPATQHH